MCQLLPDPFAAFKSLDDFDLQITADTNHYDLAANHKRQAEHHEMWGS